MYGGDREVVAPQFRIGYFIAGLIIANMFVGVLIGRGKGHDFTKKD